MTVSLRLATIDDADLLFGWANDPVTRASSFNSDPIVWEEHVAWLGRVLAEPGRRLWVAESGGPVGMVRLDQSDGHEVISVSVAPGRRGEGLASPLIRAACAEAVGLVLAEIKPGNVRSQRAFEAAGFVGDGEGRWWFRR